MAETVDTAALVAGWNKARRLDIGRALRASPDRVITAPDLSRVLQRTVESRYLVRMAEDGLLERTDPPATRPGARGRPREYAFTFAQGAEAALEEILERAHPGAVATGQQLVEAPLGAEAGLDELFQVLEDRDLTALADWGLLLDGEPQVVLVAFSGESALGAAMDLVAACAGAGLVARRRSVTELMLGPDLPAFAERRSRAFRRSALKASTRRAS